MSDTLRSLEEILESVAPVLQKRAPVPCAQFSERLRGLRAQRWRIAVAGAQGSGKSSLVRALLATAEHPDPPVPVSPREETRIPVLYRRAEEAGYRELRGEKSQYHRGALDEAGVRARASVDKRVREARYEKLDALEIGLPTIALEPDVDLVDLPGVAGRLATVSKWAVKHLLEHGSQCVVFVVDGAQTIDCNADTANLVRAFGPHMVRTVFVQNDWSGHEDEPDETARLNLAFLREHVGEEIAGRYLRMDVRAALLAARGGDRTPMRALLDTLAPFFEHDQELLAGDEAVRLANVLEEVNRLAMIDGLAARGRADAARRAHAEIAAERERIDASIEDLSRSVRDEIDKSKTAAAQSIDAALSELIGGLDTFIRDERDLRQKPFEQEVARQTGRLQRNVSRFLRTETGSLGKRIEDLSREAFASVDAPSIPTFDASVAAPKLQHVLERQLLSALKGVVGLAVGAGGAMAGATLGAQLGSAGGPVGAVVGGLAGLAVGWLAGSVIDNTAGASVSDAERTKARADLQRQVPSVRAAMLDQVNASLDKLGAEVMGRLSAFSQDRRGVQASKERASAATGEELAALDRDEARVRAAIRGLQGLLGSAEGGAS